MNTCGQQISYRSLVGAAVAVAAVGAFMENPYYLGTLVVIGLYALIGIGLGLLMGHAGQISLGQAGFYALGAYGSAILTVRAGWSGWLALPAALALSGLVAFLVGFLTLRLRGYYLALATLGFGVIIHILTVELIGLTGGQTGISGVPSLSLFGYRLGGDRRMFLLVWVLVLCGMAVYQHIVGSRIGLALRAIQSSEFAAEALGINVWAYKLQAFVISAVYAALAGSLYAHYITYIGPFPFNPLVSIQLLLIVVVGGPATIWGPVLGSGLTVLLGEFLKEAVPRLVPGAGGEYQFVAYGVILVLVLVFAPHGLGGLLEAALRRWRQV